LSIEAGISQGRYSHLERGLLRPTSDERARLAKILKTSVSSLFRSAVRHSSKAEESIQTNDSIGLS
jgi:transcriptional regulator with XRE-family HTH domain